MRTSCNFFMYADRNQEPCHGLMESSVHGSVCDSGPHALRLLSCSNAKKADGAEVAGDISDY